ncbi:hypothetical protein LFX25_03635 [Leptospira sp. FAT2]|uniref:hypothetical protein n=1 Tax=Leptospira sanjuanensis TaxID=2879643 RepID=UPI001EE8C799|nr:hypothetical protein [Leptospira sanjuanensis]MCG6192330.1 hypothetical protein [Leptospira sanjuanensis]
MKLPLWVFSYLLIESIELFPLGLSASAICRKLSVSKNTGTLLKRRLQIFCSDLIPLIKDEMVKDLKKAWKGKKLAESGDLKDSVAGKPVVHTDTLALFSASQRANGYRKRFKHKGQTASIYLTDSVAEEKGKYQIGTLVHTLAIKGGPVILSSVPDQKQKTLQPLFDFLPEDVPLFADEGIPWMERYNKNFRSINHSKRAKDTKRNVWARNRWSENGIHTQVAEGTQRSIKYSFLASYSYIRPENSILYLNEYSALKGIRVYGLERLVGKKKLGLLRNVGKGYRISNKTRKTAKEPINLLKNRQSLLYSSPTTFTRIHSDHSRSRKSINKKYRFLFDENHLFSLKQAHIDYLDFMESGPILRKQKEKFYNSIAYSIWNQLSFETDYNLLQHDFKELTTHMPVFRIIQRWAKLGIADIKLVGKNKYERKQFILKKLIPELPDVLYTFDRNQYENNENVEENMEIVFENPIFGGRNKYGINKKRRMELLGDLNGKDRKK